MNTPATPRSEGILRLLLRYIGSISLLSLVAVFMPYTWMDATHRWLGMGALPTEPVVGYMARSLSLFYASLGGLLWLCSFNIVAHRVILRYLGAAFIVFGLVVWGIDIVEELPRFWKYGEGPIVIFFGSLISILSARLEPGSDG